MPDLDPYVDLIVRLKLERDEARAERDEARAERDEAQKWLKFVADTQHRLLAAFQNDLPDAEWVAFAEALGLSRTTEPSTKETE